MKIYRHMILLVLMMSLTVASAESGDEGKVTIENLKTIREDFRKSPVSPAIVNAVTNNEIKDIAINRSAIGKINHYFDKKIEIKEITNQNSSGRCWLFAAFNVLRPKVIEKFNLKNFEFSENYSFFWDQFEKSNLFLEAVIETSDLPLDDRKMEWLLKNPIGDGGVWNMMVDIVEKYGAVPIEIMPETKHSENTRMMNRMIRCKLREDALALRDMHAKGNGIKKIRRKKTEMLADIYRILVVHLGEPPTEFIWQYEDKDGNIKTSEIFTPLIFWNYLLGDVDLHGYVRLMNDPTREYYQTYEVEYDRNMVEKPNWTYVNLPIDVIKTFAKKSLLNNEAMYFSCDVGKQLNTDIGILSLDNYDYESIYGIEFSMNKKERIITFESGSSHGMSLIGVDTLENGKTTKWLLENSWGKDKGYKGYLTMTDEWLDAYMFRLVIKKDFVTKDVIEISQKKPILLKPWDPMFLPFEDL